LITAILFHYLLNTNGALVIVAPILVDEDGFTPEKLAVLMEIKNDHYGRVADYASKVGGRVH